MSTTKATKAPANRKFGSQRGNKRAQIVRLRTKENLSWAQIGTTLDIAPRTARRLFDEKMGDGAHVGLLLGKGGRRPAQVLDTVEA